MKNKIVVGKKKFQDCFRKSNTFHNIIRKNKNLYTIYDAADNTDILVRVSSMGFAYSNGRIACKSHISLIPDSIFDGDISHNIISVNIYLRRMDMHINCALSKFPIDVGEILHHTHKNRYTNYSCTKLFKFSHLTPKKTGIKSFNSFVSSANPKNR